MLATLRWLQLVCFAWVTWLPVSQPLFLYAALAGIAGSSTVLWWRERYPVPRILQAAALVYFVFVTCVAIWSFAKGNPGALHQTVLWVGIPLIWIPWAVTQRGGQLRRTLLVVIIEGAVAAVTVILLALEALGGPSLTAPLKTVQQMWFTMAADGQIELAYLGLSSLVGLAAFALAAAFVPGEDAWLPRREVLVVVAALTFVAGIVSGRRGLAVVVLLAPILAIIYVTALLVVRRAGGVRVLAYAAGVGGAAVFVGVLMASPLGTNLNAMVGLPAVSQPAAAEVTGETEPGGTPVPDSTDDATDAAPDSNALNDSARADQLPELLAGWRAEPVVGQGFGAVLDSGYERSEARPWMFETQPLQILLNVGILGYLVLMVVTALVLAVVVRAFRVGTHRPALVGATVTCLAMLVADVTNPYLQAPGHGWAVFLVIGVCLAVMTEERVPTGAASLHESRT